jgi:hypothetical protein
MSDMGGGHRAAVDEAELAVGDGDGLGVADRRDLVLRKHLADERPRRGHAARRRRRSSRGT